MADRVKKSKGEPSGFGRQWTRRIRCLEAVLGSAPSLPLGLVLQTDHPALLERAFQLILQHNLTPEAFDLTTGFRHDSVLSRISDGDAWAFHRLLGSFGQRFAFTPDRTLLFVNLVTGLLGAFQSTHDWLLASEGVAVHVVLTGTPHEDPKTLAKMMQTVASACMGGLVIHRIENGPLQISLTIPLAPAHAEMGLGLLMHFDSPSSRVIQHLSKAV